jgi:collagenase-like PrtC family protease
MTKMTLTLGPILFHWPADDWIVFYRRVADETAIDRVCVGEIVCSKRWPFINDLILEAVERLVSAGKTVLLSLPILPTLERERRAIDELLNVPGVLPEANDVSSLAHVCGRPHAIGPFINTYNEGTLQHFVRNGAVSVCLPPELPLNSIRALAAVSGPTLEVWAFGRIPLAISARCYHARIHKRTKDSCQFACGEDSDGRDISDLDGRSLVVINGTQTLSNTYSNVIGEIEALTSAGVGSLRLSPHTGDMNGVARVYRDVIDKRMSSREANRRLAELMPNAAFSNGFLHAQPGHRNVDGALDRGTPRVAL